VPVSQSDPRRATIIGIVGVIVGTVMIVAVLFAGNLGGDSSSTTNSRARFDVGPSNERADEIKRDDTPLLFPDVIDGARPIFVQHIGEDPNSGWLAFDAADGSCVLTWHADAHDFTDCTGRHVPADGTGIHQYAATVEGGDVFVNLSPDATPTTTAPNSRS
jgi:hypothetical protein